VAAPTFVAAGAITAGGPVGTANATPALPSAGSLQAGDIILAHVVWLNRNANPGIPIITGPSSPWQQVSYDAFDPSGFAADGEFAVWWAPWTSGMAAPTFQMFLGDATTSTYIAQTFAVRGADAVSPIDVVGAAAETPSATSTLTIPGVTTNGPDRLLVALFVKFAQASGYGTSPGGSPIGSINTAAGQDGYYGSVYRAIPSAGAVADWVFTIGGSPAAALMGKMYAITPSADVQTLVAPSSIPSGEAFLGGVITGASDQVLTAPSPIASGEAFPSGGKLITNVVGTAPIPSGESFPTGGTVTAFTPEPGVPDQPVTLQRFSADVFPPGTSVSIHEAHMGWPDRAPVGVALSTATVDARGSFNASGLSAGKWYVAYARVAGKHRYLRFRYEVSPT